MGNYNSKRNKAIANKNKSLLTRTNDPAILQAINNNNLNDGSTGETLDEQIAYLNKYLIDLAHLAENQPGNANDITRKEKLIDDVIKKIENGFVQYKGTHDVYDMDDYKKYEFLTDAIKEYQESKQQLLTKDGYNIDTLQNEFNQASKVYHEQIDEELAMKYDNFDKYFEESKNDKDLYEDFILRHTGKKTITPEEYIRAENNDQLVKDLKQELENLNKEIENEEAIYNKQINEFKVNHENEISQINQEHDQKIAENENSSKEQIESYRKQKEEALKQFKETVPTEFRESFVDQKAIASELLFQNVRTKYQNMGIPLENGQDAFDWITNVDDEKAVEERYHALDKSIEELTKQQASINESLIKIKANNQADDKYLDTIKNNFGKDYALVEKYIYSKNTPQPEAPPQPSEAELEAERLQEKQQRDEYEKKNAQALANRRALNAELISTHRWILTDYNLNNLQALEYVDPRNLVNKIREAQDPSINLPPENELNARLNSCILPEEPRKKPKAVNPLQEAYDKDKALRITKEEEETLNKAVLSAIEKEPRIIKLRNKIGSLNKYMQNANNLAEKYKTSSFANYSEKDLPKLAEELKNFNGLSDINLQERYQEYKDAAAKRKDAQSVISSNKGLGKFWSKPMDVLGNSIKQFNEFLNDPKTKALEDKLDGQIAKAFKDNDSLQSVFNTLRENNNNDINNPDGYAYAAQILAGYGKLVDSLKNIKTFNNPESQAFQKKILSILSPLDSVASNKNLVDALNVFNEPFPDGRSIFETLSNRYLESTIPMVEGINTIEQNISKVQRNYLEFFIQRQKQNEVNKQQEASYSKALQQVNNDLAYCNQCQNVLVAKQTLLNKNHAHQALKSNADEMSNKEQQAITEKLGKAKQIHDEKNNKIKVVNDKYGVQIKEAEETYTAKKSDLSHKHDVLNKLYLNLQQIDYIKGQVVDNLGKVKDKQRMIRATNASAISEFKQAKTHTQHQFDNKEDDAMTEIQNSTKKYGFDSKFFKNVVKAIKEYKLARAKVETGELTEEQYNTLTAKLEEHLDIYINKRKEDAGTTKKGTPQGQKRLDAMRKMKALIGVRKQQIKDFAEEEKSLVLPKETNLTVGSDLEKAIIEVEQKTNPKFKIDYNVDKSILQNNLNKRKETQNRFVQKNEPSEHKKMEPKDLHEKFLDFFAHNKKVIKPALLDHLKHGMDNMSKNNRVAVNTAVACILISKDSNFNSKDMASISNELEAYRQTAEVRKIGDALLGGLTSIDNVNKKFDVPDNFNTIKTMVEAQKTVIAINKQNGSFVSTLNQEQVKN